MKIVSIADNHNNNHTPPKKLGQSSTQTNKQPRLAL